MAVETITTVLVPAPTPSGGTDRTPAWAYDLTDLVTVKDELNITDTKSDDFLQRGISQASQIIRNECNRTFQVETVQDVLYIQQDPYPFQVPGGVFALQLSRWPLVDAAPVNFTGNLHGTTTVDGLVAAPGSSLAGIAEGSLIFAPVSLAGVPVTENIAPGTIVASVNVSGGSLTLSAAALASGAAQALNTGLSVVQTIAAGVGQLLTYGTDFTVDADRGWLIRLDTFTGIAVKWEALPTTVIYQAGFPTIPYDLVEATLRYVTLRYSARGRDPMLRAQDTQGLGRQEWWVGGPPKSGNVPEELVGVIDRYRVPVIG
jgi:hypothetical protein